MSRRKVDTSRAKCDTCGLLYKPGDAVYAIADKFDEEIEDRDVLVSFRHWGCNTPIDVAVKNLGDTIKRAEQAMDKLRGMRS